MWVPVALCICSDNVVCWKARIWYRACGWVFFFECTGKLWGTREKHGQVTHLQGSPMFAVIDSR